MKITDIRTYLMNGSPANISAGTRGSQKARNWLFVKVFTDEGLEIKMADECISVPNITIEIIYIIKKIITSRRRAT